MSMVSPVSLHTASSQTHSEKLTARAHKPQGGKATNKEKEGKRNCSFVDSSVLNVITSEKS